MTQKTETNRQKSLVLMMHMKNLNSPEFNPALQLLLRRRTFTFATRTRPRSAPCGATPPPVYVTVTSSPFATVTPQLYFEYMETSNQEFG